MPRGEALGLGKAATLKVHFTERPAYLSDFHDPQPVRLGIQQGFSLAVPSCSHTGGQVSLLCFSGLLPFDYLLK